jgi:hypothetical protein
MVLLTHVQQAVQITLKTVSDEGHFTLEAEILFQPIFPTFAELTE